MTGRAKHQSRHYAEPLYDKFNVGYGILGHIMILNKCMHADKQYRYTCTMCASPMNRDSRVKRGKKVGLLLDCRRSELYMYVAYIRRGRG